ncbi:hypothetical protein SAMN05444166_5146 [Singulisphaera sp. GP187]|uniref:hypothetical protein n=1 Tax=Singulisphaera sp. GP187 TaxID=1882752 RepID=UPI000929F42A|nr:hypothetical protein [Singulisphaera sp. GP187]SIO55811.1 hypothetical protein SAMN05444166_5146 [Singulisphaera sp. GP187]
MGFQPTVTKLAKAPRPIAKGDVVRRTHTTIRKSGPFRATFSTTNGLERTDGRRDYHDRVMKLYPELFEPVGVTFASISPRGSARYDAIRTAADLRPDPRQARPGQVITPQGEAARAAQVIVLPTTAGPFAALDVSLAGTQLRDPYDEQWSPTDENGHFVVYPKDDDDLLMILHPSGFAIQAGAQKADLIRLQPWAALTFNSTGDVADQNANVGIRPVGLKPSAPGVRVASIATTGNPVEVQVPAGEIALSRSLAMGEGVSISLPVEQFSLRPGEVRTLEIKPPSEADRKRAREIHEQFHPARGNDR